MNAKRDVHEAEASLAELARLTDTAGSEPVGEVLVRRDKPDAATFIGSGKAAELTSETASLDVDVVVVDGPLSPAQQRNLEKLFGCDVVDREALILDIFAQHATSRAGMLQVELAQLRYRLPRLRGRGVEMSRLGGGIGTRGPGETKLEVDRRRVLTRISKLEKELVRLGETRRTQRKARLRSGLPIVALVGYTNAGKSTILNRFTDAGVLVEDRLFSTLDPTVRRLDLPGQAMLLTDTVGFVRNLPHHLVEAFRSTLEQVAEADLLAHVVDAADPDPDRQIASVRTVLDEIGAAGVPELLVFNKTDLADPLVVNRLLNLYQPAVAVSARTGEGFEGFTRTLIETAREQSSKVELLIPFTRGDVLAALHRDGEVLDQQHEDGGTRVTVRLRRATAERYAGFIS